eukprot:gene6712-8906_t
MPHDCCLAILEGSAVPCRPKAEIRIPARAQARIKTVDRDEEV